MKSICTTGMRNDIILPVFDILQRKGLRQVKPSRQLSDYTIEGWHERLLKDQVGLPSSRFSPLRPGRSWELLAGDIFLANLEEPLWGWADSASLRFLDFWLDFEPCLHFLLVTATPQRALATDQNALLNPSWFFEEWQIVHEALLRFHLRHPSRSLLVDVEDCLIHPDQLAALCAERWEAPFSTPLHLAAEVAPKVDPLPLFLAEQLCTQQKTLLPLVQEIEAGRCRLDPQEKPHTTSLIPGPDVIAAYTHLIDRDSLARQVDKDAAILEQLTIEREQFSDLAEETQSRIIQLTKECDISRRRVEKFKDLLDKQIAEHNKTKCELRNALNRLDLQREEFIRHQREASCRYIETGELILKELLKAQEDSVCHYKAFMDTENKLLAATKHMNRLHKRAPFYIDYDGLKMEPVAGDPANASWTMENVYFAGREIPRLHFETRLEQDDVALIFSDTSFLIRLPLLATATEPLYLSFDATSPEQMTQRHALMLELAQDDWLLLQALCRHLFELLSSATTVGLPEFFPRERLAKALASFLHKLVVLPPVLRFNAVRLVRKQINPDYEHLWIALDRPTLGERQWLRFEFRISCADVTPYCFGNQPKLEFPEPESPDNMPLENWYAESQDDFGMKLELRFAREEAMDLVVWTRLSDLDQLFVAALIERLQAILAALREEDLHLLRAWSDWTTAAETIRSIYFRCVLASPSSKTA